VTSWRTETSAVEQGKSKGEGDDFIKLNGLGNWLWTGIRKPATGKKKDQEKYRGLRGNRRERS